LLLSLLQYQILFNLPPCRLAISTVIALLFPDIMHQKNLSIFIPLKTTLLAL